MERKFYKDTAEAMIRWKDAQGTTVPHAEALVIQDDGVVVEESYRDESPQDHVFDWTPVDDMDWHGAPNPLKARALPIPFTAAELAAFMLDGAGYGLQEYLDRHIGYPLDDEALECFGGNRYRVVREALQSAYALAEQTQSVVGEYDYEEEKRAVDMRKQFENENGRANTREGVFEPGISADEQRERRKRAVESVADLKEQVLQAEDQTRNKWAAWRKAMVKELLQPSPTVSEVAADAPTQSTQAAPVVYAGDGPAPLTTTIHSTKTRRDTLTPVIEQAQTQCRNATDTAEVWGALLVLAEKKTAPLIGATEEGLQYLKHGTVAIFKRNSLGKRLAR